MPPLRSPAPIPLTPSAGALQRRLGGRSGGADLRFATLATRRIIDRAF